MSENTTKESKEISIAEKEFMYSIPYFFIKSKFKLTSKRIEGKIPNLLLFIPTGKDNVTYPLNNVSGVKISTKFYLKSFILGLIIALIGITIISDSFFGGAIATIIGALILLNAFRTLIVIENSGGGTISYSIAPMERSSATELINQINNAIIEKS